MNTDAETVVRAAYRAAERSVLDVRGFVDLFAEDVDFPNVVAREIYRGEHLGDQVAFMGAPAPDVHRELHRFGVRPDFASAVTASAGCPS
ncbi:hypothetical protein [Streptomyces sp. NPDC097981]|uniref:hypothetical protein n=1 Tax=Streptomyces sp. NPDC097981 TaxID=3155428 RepID=UPI00332038E6